MPRLLVVHHTPSPSTRELLEEVLAGTRLPELDAVDVVSRPALGTSIVDVLEADGYLLGTPANFGYMSGALKHFFDTVYYPCLDATAGRPYGLWVHGASDVAGAVRAVRSLAGGLGWTPVARPVEVTGTPDNAVREACRELGATVAATLLDDGGPDAPGPDGPGPGPDGPGPEGGDGRRDERPGPDRSID